jgi:mRNA-degrading endonuclease RelE of RelBE toxin-antitoxin system
MPFQIKFAESFREDYRDLEKSEKERIHAFIPQLKENPLMVGKPLGYTFFREKKFNGKRIYFIIYEEWNIVLLARISDKKSQPHVIAWIKLNLPYLRHFVEKSLREKQFLSNQQ